MTKTEAYAEMFSYGEVHRKRRRKATPKTKNGIRVLNRQHPFTLQDAAHVTKLQAA